MGKEQIYFGVMVGKQRAEYLMRCLDEPLCPHCGREIAECSADPCHQSAAGDIVSINYDDGNTIQFRYTEAVKKGGFVCPSCGGHEGEGFGFDVDANTASQKVVCHDCPAVWYDRYALVGYQLEEENDCTN